MALDAYSPCPCGSGKKFKWCCQPIHGEVEKAFRLEGDGQHEAALRAMDEVIAAHPANPEPLGRKSQLLYQNERGEEAEQCLDKAFAINPNYPFGFLLRGMFRQNEGELPGALTLFRKAVDLYDQEARDILAQTYTWIGECEFRLNNPVASHAAIKIAVHCDPANTELRQAYESMYGPESMLPAPARKEYSFQSPPASLAPERREVWDRALKGDLIKLGDAVKAFEQITSELPEEAAGWFNLGLARAWAGANRAGLEALDRYIQLETDENKAVEAWALAEVLRCGIGMEEVSDHIEHSALYEIRDPAKMSEMLGQLQTERRFAAVQVNPEQALITGMVFENKPSLTPQAAQQHLGLGSYLLILVDHLRLWNTNPDRLKEARADIEKRAGPALSEPRLDEKVATFNDLLADTLSFPIGFASKEEAEKKVKEYGRDYFLEKWIHKPLKSLGGVPPVDAASQPKLRGKVLGVIQFLEECSKRSTLPIEFEALRRKLGLVEGGPPADGASSDISSLSAAELAGLDAATLEQAQLQQAFQAAMKLDARELAGKFAKILVDKPAADGGTADKYPWFSHLIQLAQAEGNTAEALACLDAGEKSDCEENEGRRRNDYELRRAQLHAKSGDIDSAADAFEKLAQRSGEAKHWGAAAEAMLSAKRGDRAGQFAEKGLALARTNNDRDSEQYLLELQEAASKMQ